MNVISINCKLNNDDVFSPSEEAIEINLLKKNKYHYTFFRDILFEGVPRTPFKIAPEGLDLLFLSMLVYYADRRIKREDFPDGWTRKFKLYVPVIAIDIWNENRGLVIEMLSFLSGDSWDIEFREREENAIEKKLNDKYDKMKGFPNKYSKLCMLSGGLDSYIGAIDLLSVDLEILFVGHYGGGSGVTGPQKLVKKSLMKEYSVEERCFFNFNASPINGVEDTTRTRSFMFFAHAISLASGFDKPTPLYIPENGLISLNIPLSISRLGSSSTRTTHPYYMELLQGLITNLGFQTELRNPYQFMTKGEMINECIDSSFLESTIPLTMSCSHPDYGRYAGESKPRHCGTCYPCLIRRSALGYSHFSDPTDYRDIDFTANQARKNLSVYKKSIVEYSTFSEIKKYMRIQLSGKLKCRLPEFKSLYERGMDELSNLLEKYEA